MEGWIQRDVAVDLFKKAGLDFDALKAKAQTRDFKPVELTGAKFSADYKVKHEVIVSKNIAGVVKGSKYPDEYVCLQRPLGPLGRGPAGRQGRQDL
jgi:Zn-dependent M28 family amino/carboxypeptidase